jgi:hypothetical protein
LRVSAKGSPWIDHTFLPLAHIGDIVSNTVKGIGNLALLTLNSGAGALSLITGDYEESQRLIDDLSIHAMTNPITGILSLPIQVGRAFRFGRLGAGNVPTQAAATRIDTTIETFGSGSGQVTPDALKSFHDELDAVGANSGRANDVPDYVTRNDNNFLSTVNDKGKPKAYINEYGDLVPPNPSGTGTIQTHVRGSAPENSPFISTTDPKSTMEPKSYGSDQVRIDTKKLQQDINAGQVTGTQIISPQQLQTELQIKVNQAQIRYDTNPSKKNADRLRSSQQDFNNATRDGECLIQGCVPAKYLKRTRN